jgi:hypothetical protein
MRSYTVYLYAGDWDGKYLQVYARSEADAIEKAEAVSYLSGTEAQGSFTVAK